MPSIRVLAPVALIDELWNSEMKNDSLTLVFESASARQKREAAERKMGTAVTMLAEAVKNAPDDCWGQLAYFFRHYRIPAAQGRARSVSQATETKYVQTIRLLITALAEENIRINNLSELTRKHLLIGMRKWEERCSASTLQTRYSCLKRFYSWLGKELSFKNVKETMLNPDKAKRVYSAVEPKAWSSKGVDLEQMVDRLGEECAHSAMYLRLARGFGLRVQEAAALRPHESDRGSYLEILHGAKGGRGRGVPIRTEEQRQIIEDAKKLADPKTGLLRSRRHTIQQARSRFYFLLSKHGLTKAQLGVTAHGLRHEYANAVFEEIAGVPAPVNQSQDGRMGQAGKPDRALEMQARKAVTSALGHGRTSVTTAYTGSVLNIDRHQMRQMKNLLGQLQSPAGGLFGYMRGLAAHLGQQADLRLHVIGPEANGVPMHGGPLLLSVSYLDQQGLFVEPPEGGLGEIIRTMAAIVQSQMGRMCFIHDARNLPQDTPRLEVLFQNDTPAQSN